MAETTEISWAHSTFNPWIGCTKVSPGCDHCYAERDMAIRRGRVEWGAGKARSRTSAAYWKQPMTWDRKARESGEPWRVFCASLADVFDNEVDPDWRADLWDVVRRTPSLTWMVLTKRIGNAHAALRGAPVRRLWLGITCVNQEELDRDWPKLERIPAAVRWLSLEPLLGPITLEAACPDWVIVGGESGPHARPMEAQWARDLRDECRQRGIAFHFKQWGGMRPKSNGHLLDGQELRFFPPHARDSV